MNTTLTLTRDGWQVACPECDGFGVLESIPGEPRAVYHCDDCNGTGAFPATPDDFDGATMLWHGRAVELCSAGDVLRLDDGCTDVAIADLLPLVAMQVAA